VAASRRQPIDPEEAAAVAAANPWLPPAGWRLALFAAAFLLPGLLGHDPWKTDDAIGIGIVHSMLERGAWLTPELAGEAYLEDGPLFYWLAALSALAFGSLLPAHDAMRLATLLSMAVALYFTRLAARELYGKRAGDLSVLALAGCLGLMAHAHEATAETAMLGALAGAYYGIAIAWKKPLKAGICFGLGSGCAFLSKGLVAFIPPVAAALILVPVAMASRTRSFVFAAGIGAVIATALVLGWVLAAVAFDPEYVGSWLAWQFDHVASRPRWSVSREYLKMLAWAAWPVWPLALWAIWAFRSQLPNPRYAVPLVASLVSLAILLASPSARELDALAMLVPLAIPAGAVVMNLRRGAANALAWFSVMTFGLAALAIWAFWLAVQLGFPQPMAGSAARLEPGFVPEVHVPGLLAALALTAAWGALAFRMGHSTLRAIPMWTAGAVLVWGLAMTLWIHWIDYGKTYRHVAQGLAANIVADEGCIASRGLGQVQRAAFHYHGGIVTRRTELGRGATCPYLLVQTTAVDDEEFPDYEFFRIWEGGRPRDRERYWLFKRID